MCVCVCVCVCARERDEHFYEVNFIFTKVVLAHSGLSMTLIICNKKIEALSIIYNERESLHNEY